MKHNVTRTLLTVLTVILALVLVALLGLAGVLILRDAEPAHTVPTLQTQPSQTTSPTTQPTTAPTTVPTTVPEETTVPTTAPTEPPEPEVFTLSFAGDCTLGNHIDKTGPSSFIGTVGDDYAYPFADVQEWFATDDCTFVNLECALTDGGKPNTNKQFTFKGPAAYTAILTEGSVEFANVVNNHAKDYGTSGYQDTLANLDAVNVYYAEQDDTRVFTTESGLTIGVYASYFPESTWGVSKRIEAMRSEGAEIIIVAVHWGEEYDYHPNSNEKKMGHQFIDAGADIVWGHHPHVLQDIEEYNGGIIYYSLGNFSFGGNSSPSDKDTAIIQQQIVREPDGTVHLGEMTIIPCHVSGILTWGNDYQPTPMEEGSDAYNRVLRKLDGSFELEGADVPYRDDLNKEPTTPTPEPTVPEATVPEETTPEPTVPEETVPEETVPAPTDPAPTDPEPTVPEQPTPDPEPEPEPQPEPEPEPEPEPQPQPEPSSEEPVIGDGYIVTPTGEVLTYTDMIVCTGTAYSCDGELSYTYSGTVAAVGSVAVDPDVIPLGTRMYIVSSDGEYVYGVGTAEDIGTGVDGAWVDLYFNTTDECWIFGKRPCNVYILG